MLHLSKHCRVLAVVCFTTGTWACNVTPISARLDAASDRGDNSSGDSSPDNASEDAERDLPGDTPGQADARADAREGDAAQDSAVDGALCSRCTDWGAPQAEGLSPAVLTELSGLAASHVHPGLLYGHNDSGDSARFFALTPQGHVNAELHLADATATDWEDISVGPCPSGSCVYIGDTGDNKADRAQYVIHRLAEPATLPADGSVVTIPATSYESFPFVYPDGPHNAETLLVHPVTGQIFIVIKETGIDATVYEMPLPLQADQQVTLTLFSALTLSPIEGVVTDGSFHPCGDRLLIRTTGTTGLFELTRAAGASMTSLFMATPVRVPVPIEPQGESVTYSLDGRSYFTGSETVSGQPVPSLSMITCQAF